MDPMDFFLFDEFINPNMKYECQNCGTLFGDESIVWDEENQCYVAVCPACGNQTAIENEEDN